MARTFALQDTFYLTQIGILRKDDAFEVVLDPGSDEVEKRCLGPVPAYRGNTGCRLTRRYSSRENTLAQPGIHRLTELVNCTCGSSAGQFRFSRDQIVPLRKGLWSRNANWRRHQHQVHAGQIMQWINLFAMANTQHRSADQEKGHVAAYLGGNPHFVPGGDFRFECMLQPKHGCNCIGRARAHTALHGQALVDLDDDLATTSHLMIVVLKGILALKVILVLNVILFLKVILVLNAILALKGHGFSRAAENSLRNGL